MINTDENLSPKFFLGANSPSGFVSRFDNLYYPEEGWFAYIIKGGPGTGKSTLMKKLSELAACKSINFELIYCSSDPSSLDAVIFPELKVCIADGTAPHTIDPISPGVSDTIVNLCDCWNKKNLLNLRNDIIDLSKKNSFYHKKSKKYLSAYAKIDNEIYRLAQNYYDKDKIAKYSENLSQKYFKKPSQNKGFENIRFISGITPDGIVFFEESLKALSEKTLIIDDEYGVAGNIILSIIRENAINSGLNLFSCYCPTNPFSKLEAIIIPEIKLSFVVSNNYHKISNLENFQVIHSKRFLNSAYKDMKKQRINFDNKIKQDLINESISNLKQAKSIHDDIENLYSSCMDYKMVNNLTKKLSNEIFKNFC